MTPSLEVRPHGIALVRPLARATVIGAFGAMLVVVGTGTGWAVAAAGALVLLGAAAVALRAVLAWDGTRLCVAPDRLLVRHGILRRRTAEVDLAGGTAVEVEQGLVGRLLGYGTLVAGELEIPHVPRARRIRRLVG